MKRIALKFVPIIISVITLIFQIPSSFAITSLSELKVSETQSIAITAKYNSLYERISSQIEKATFAQEEFLRLRSETKARGVEFQASHNYLRAQIKKLYQIFESQSEIILESSKIFKQILKSPKIVTEFIATRPTVYLPPECPPALALDGESIWETGTVVRVEDGDTVDVQTCRGILNVRQIGIQAPETVKSTHFAQCGGLEASNFMKALLPVGTEVQLRSNNFASVNNYEALARPYRYIFKKDKTGNFTVDVQSKLLEAGLAMWFPIENEYLRNLQYLELLNFASTSGTGLWSGALCKNETDKTPFGAIEIWVETDSPLQNEDPFGEYVLLHSKNDLDLDLSGWSIRDTSLELFQRSFAFPFGTILKARGILTIYLGAPLINFPLAQDEIALGLTKPILQNPSSAGGKFTGDGIYLQTPLTGAGGGNMRAWIHRPCVPTDCVKPDWLSKNSENVPRTIPLPQTLSILLNPIKYGRVVPDMIGLTPEQASVALTPLQLLVSIVDKSNQSTGDKGVTDQNPKAGAYLPINGSVTVYVDVKR